jgi:hypothetical protein
MQPFQSFLALLNGSPPASVATDIRHDQRGCSPDFIYRGIAQLAL